MRPGADPGFGDAEVHDGSGTMGLVGVEELMGELGRGLDAMMAAWEGYSVAYGHGWMDGWMDADVAIFILILILGERLDDGRDGGYRDDAARMASCK